MFELSVACKYLVPRWRQLSVSMISMISILVIALVVWLIVVFFSVTHGLEKSWIQKLISLTAPIRLTPTPEYYRSYYYLIDSISEGSGYSSKSIGEKWHAAVSDPYDPSFDEEIPKTWPTPKLDAESNLVDPVKTAFAILQAAPFDGLKANDYETTFANMDLHLPKSAVRKTRGLGDEGNVSFPAYIGIYDPANEARMLMSLTEADQFNLKRFPENILAFREANGPLPSHPKLGEAVFLPKGFRDGGVMVGDTGHVTYYAPTTSSVQELQIPVWVAGFYDPGIIPIGGKYVLATRELAGIVRSAHNKEDNALTNGINVRFDNFDDAEKIKAYLTKAFEEAGIDRYWHLETFREYDFSKDLMQQLRSEKNLFSLIATVVIIVACSNIISMLIILVNDKKLEIGILRSMGASSLSIALIFGFCGVVMGMMGSLLGIGAAILTLHNLQPLVNFISALQGYDMFNPVYYGDSLPTELSFEALFFVMVVTGIISMLAGIVPAAKASMLRPSVILRSE